MLLVALLTPRSVAETTTSEAFTTTQVLIADSTMTEATTVKPGPLEVLCFIIDGSDPVGDLADGLCSKMFPVVSVAFQRIREEKHERIRSWQAYLIYDGSQKKSMALFIANVEEA
ncbi:uncharacterized protein LOC142558352 [Dermacentor variabilis]|uniref:uncharacterized protein LOC142558352 n=1 Tax=Dermacentor variabilis TaxID=34621 RepID=UPI003F5BDA1C